MKLFYVALALFIFVWIALFKPYEMHRQKPVDSVLHLYDFVYKELDVNKTRIELFGRRGRYIGKRFDVEGPRVIDKRKMERISAVEGRYNKGVITFVHEVRFVSKEYKALADRAVYDTKKEILRIPTRFWLYAKDMNVTGRGFVYYKSSGKIVAHDIFAKVFQR